MEEEQLNNHVTNSSNDVYNFNLITQLTNSIEKMNKTNQIKVLQILVDNNIVINENQYGTHINMSELDVNVLKLLNDFNNYVSNQESVLNVLEEKKETIQNIYFSK